MVEHERVANKASHVAPTPQVVAEVLLNRSPANARDMAELVRDHLAQLAKKIQFEETNLIETFYRPVTASKPGSSRAREAARTSRPKVENDCRDVLQALLRDRLLAVNVQIEKESMAAGDKRADLQASTIVEGRRVIVPVEVKKDDHPEVWTAWRDQLAKRYCANPAAQGIGIYLVLWFGYQSVSSPSGVQPASARHMAELLDANIPADRRVHVVGLVVDLSRNLP